MPVSIEMVVVLPAPLWPSRAVMRPRGMSRLSPSTATCRVGVGVGVGEGGVPKCSLAG
jgi:hypothetical protein